MFTSKFNFEINLRPILAPAEYGFIYDNIFRIGDVDILLCPRPYKSSTRRCTCYRLPSKNRIIITSDIGEEFDIWCTPAVIRKIVSELNERNICETKR